MRKTEFGDCVGLMVSILNPWSVDYRAPMDSKIFVRECIF